jgi:5-methylcytosine-specific restriction endonuclease McrA
MESVDKFIDWCLANGWQQVVQADIDRRNAQAFGASIFSQSAVFLTNKRDYYRQEYLKSEHWTRLKGEKLARNPHCERCPSTLMLDVHHSRYRNLYDVTVADLLTLCRRCHDYEHARIEAQQQEKWETRVNAAARILKRDSAQFEAALHSMGVTAINIAALVENSVFKFGIFRTAFSTCPIVLLRMAYLTLCGKREFHFNQQVSSAEVLGCVKTGVTTS